MRLLRLQLGDFRGDRDLRIEFGDDSPVNPSLTFLVGPNGVGKSRVLEQVGRIFSHLSSHLPAGFDYELEYEIEDRRVLISTEAPDFAPSYPGRLGQIQAWIAIAPAPFAGWRSEHLQDRLPDLNAVLPFRVVGLSTGPTSRLDWALRHSPRATLAQRNSVQKRGKGEAERRGPIRADEVEERCIPLSGEELLLALLALLSHPVAVDGTDEIRDHLLGRAGLGAESLLAFAFEVPPDWRERLPRSHHPHFEQLLDRAARRVALDTDSPEIETAERRHRAVFELTSSLRSWIGENADSPFIWFNQMLNWLQVEAITSLRLVLQKRDEPGLLLDYDFSDGEFLFTGRYALLLLLRMHKDCLVLFDEPETHFNDRWKVDVVYDLQRVLEESDAHVLIATHSDLTLTDAHRSEVLVLSDDSRVTVEQPGQPPLSPLAANRSEITRQIFGARAPSGRRGLELVRNALASGDAGRIEKALDEVGPGYHQFELQRALSELEERQ